MNAFLQLAFYLVVLIALAKPLGAYMAASTRASAPSSRRCSAGSSACSTACPA